VGLFSQSGRQGSTWDNEATVTYTPALRARGYDRFQFVANNGEWDSAPATVTLTNWVNTPPATTNGPRLTVAEDFRGNDGQADGNIATVFITVRPVNDIPTALSQTVYATEDQPIQITLTSQDVEGGPISYQINGWPTNGGILTGLDQYGRLPGTNATLTYVPPANFSGTDAFWFRAIDGYYNSAGAWVTVIVDPVNDTPSATNQTVGAAEDTTLAITPAAGDIDGDSLAFTVVDAPDHGSVTWDGTQFLYVPETNYAGADSFGYRVEDPAGGSASATITIDVQAVNDAPVAYGQSVIATYNTAKTITLTGSDVDVNPLTYSIVTGPTNGTLSGTAPNVTYIPNVGSAGADRFTFRVNDGAADSAVATVSITTQNPSGVPAAPTSLVVTVPTVTKTLILNWNDNSTNEDGFKIERSPNGNNSWAQIATTGINIRTYTNSGLSSNTRYYYRVRSFNRLGNSAYSNTANGKTR